MGDVSFVPQRDVFHRRSRVPAQQASQSTDAFADDRIALMGHRRRTFLACSERFLNLSYLSALEVTDLLRKTLQRRTGDRNGREKVRVSVAGNDLRRGVFDPE